MIDFENVMKLNKTVSGLVSEALEAWGIKYQAKNRNYGASWLLSGQTLSMWFPNGLQLKTHKDQIIHGLVVRMLDKLIRASNLMLADGTDEVGEAASETFFDLGIYAFMAGTACFIGTTADDFRAALSKQASSRAAKEKEDIK